MSASRALVVVLTAVAGSACVRVEEPIPLEPSSGPPPVPTAMLNAVYSVNGGLIPNVAADDPALAEARRYYDTIGVPAGNAEAPAATTAPLSFDDWKRVFGFPAREPGEGLQAYRDRAGVAVYYNRNELGLGRELGCARFVDGIDDDGAPIEGIACYVTNYGPGFRQPAAALADAIAGRGVRNTVCISYRPTMPAGYEVQFYVYGATGARQDWAQLDTLGARPQPQVCMTCHGGGYDGGRHLAKNARFLPIDPNLVIFANDAAAETGTTRAGQEERLRVLNGMAAETPLTAAQQIMVYQLYRDGLRKPGSAATGDVTPPGWQGTAADGDFYREVVRPYCATCHLAAQRGLTDAERPDYSAFASAAAFDGVAMDAFVCGSFSMPNAQPTSLGFWDAFGNPGVVIGGVPHATAADAFLARRGLGRANCARYDAVAGCDRGEDPDALCGGNVNGGAVCDRDTKRCAPVVTSSVQ